MPYGMYMSAAGAYAQNERMQMLAHNLANVDTVGFKQEMAVFQARHAAAVEQGEVSPGAGGIDDLGGGVHLAETTTDFSDGKLRHTSMDTDLAIRGDGFFLVQKEDQVLLTRAGNFHLDQTGRLMTAQGYSVLSESGGPVTLNPSEPFRVSPGGVIRQGSTAVPLAIAQPTDTAHLLRAGENLFEPLQPPAPVPVAERQVAQGYLELSTVEPVTAMIDMIEASRAYEANVKLIQHHDHVVGSLINRILRS